MISDISRTRQAIPQVVELQLLSDLNSAARERGRAAVVMHERVDERVNERGRYPNGIPYSHANYSPGDATLV